MAPSNVVSATIATTLLKQTHSLTLPLVRHTPVKVLQTATPHVVVYWLACECGCFYIGWTKCKFHGRLAEHKYAIRTENMSYPMAKHYKEPGHSSPNSLKAMFIDTVVSLGLFGSTYSVPLVVLASMKKWTFTFSIGTLFFDTLLRLLRIFFLYFKKTHGSKSKDYC